MHTKGPWQQVKVDGELTGSIFSGRKRVCSGIFDDIKLKPEAEANARLIAAAPFLLETLEEVMDMWAQGEPANEHPEYCDAVKCRLNQIRNGGYNGK